MSNSELSLADFESRGDSVRALIHDFHLDRMSQGVLILASAGAGKRTLARLLAQGLLCTAQGGDKPCALCRACKRVVSGTHPNLLRPVLTAKDKNIKIDHIRQILLELGRHSLEQGKRVVLIEDFDTVMPQAQNALLKSIEEADENDYFILTASQENAVLTTIRSRCRIVRLCPLTDSQVADLLVKRGISHQEAEMIAVNAEGNIAWALEKADHTEQTDSLFSLVMDTFFGIHSRADVPSAELRLKDFKDDLELLLNIFEGQVRLLLRQRAKLTDISSRLPGAWQKASSQALLRLCDEVLAIRTMSASYVSYSGLINRLLTKIAEEITVWSR